jgi:pSer/pThr/pTyr-binding forkhead associated (FHA) protein/PAS domain-containing protein
MYKLVAIGGKLRGKEFILKDGENIFGREDDCTHPLKLDGVSKKHMSITITKDLLYLEDLGSSNGTFVNGKLVRKTPIQNGDKVALPNVIFQVVYVIEKKVIIKKKSEKKEEQVIQDILDVPPPPDNALGKIIYSFKFKIMPIVYEFNKEYEWRSIIAVLLTLLVAISIFITISPTFLEKRNIIFNEVSIRGTHYADDIARMNALYLSRRNLDSIDTNFLANEPGVKEYELIDLEGRIIRPLSKMNDYTSDTFTLKIKEKVKELGENRNLEQEDRLKYLGDGEIGVADVIKAHNVRTGTEEVVGIITIKFNPTSMSKEGAENSNAFMKAFVVSMMVAVLIFGIIYFATIKHVEDLRMQVENLLRGRQKELTSLFKWMEMIPVLNTLNSVLLKYMEQQTQGREGSSMEQVEDDGKYIEILRGFLEAAAGPAMILNSEKLLVAMNTEAEDVTGIRESASTGNSLLDIARDQGFAATVIELCDQCANSGGMPQKGQYELTGKDYDIHVNAMIGRDNFAKAYFISFIKDK